MFRILYVMQGVLYIWTKQYYLLSLIGMRENTLHSLSFLDQIFSAEFLSKISKLFWR